MRANKAPNHNTHQSHDKRVTCLLGHMTCRVTVTINLYRRAAHSFSSCRPLLPLLLTQLPPLGSNNGITFFEI